MIIIKKILIGIGIAILSILLILIVTPILFKGKLIEIAKTELNKMLAAEVEFSDLQLSFIRNFPNAYIALEDLSVTGTGDFEGITLAAFKKFSVTVDIVSVIKMDNIQVKSILLDSAEANAVILEDGRANWDIMKKAENGGEDEEAITEAAPKDDEETESEGGMPINLNVALKRFEIRNTRLSYRDFKGGMEASVDDLNLVVKGDMAKEIVDLDLDLRIDGVNFWLNKIQMLTDAQIGFKSLVAADLKNMGFTLRDNRFNLNELIFKFSGFFGMPAGEGINLDIAFATEKTDFKSLLSLVPVIYMQDFSSLETTGSLALSGGAKGAIKDGELPRANVDLTVDNAMFKYPALPKSVDNINIALNAFYDGANFDNTTLDIDKFDFTISGNPFGAGLHVKTPESDMQVAARFAGKIDFNSVKDIVPLDDITLNGLLECDLTLAGRMSMLENEQYEDFTADGMLKISGFDFESPDFPQAARISNIHLIFNPRRVELAAFDAAYGSTDISLKGNLENFIPFVFNGDTVRGNLNLASNNINLNEIMSGDDSDKKEEKEKPEEKESAPLTVVEVPKNIDFTLNADIGRILFDKLDITNTKGLIILRDGSLNMRNLSMNLLEGSMVINGEYNTQDIHLPKIDFGLNIRQFDITSALSSFEILENILPNPQNYTGRVSANLTIDSILANDMKPVINTINSKGRLQTQNLQIKNSPLFGTLATLTKNESFRSPAPENLDIGFEIKDGRLIIEPIQFNISQTKLEISGEQGLDTTLDYKVKAAVPVASIGAGAQDLFNRIPGGSSVRELPISGSITGTPKNPNVSLDAGDMAGAVTETVRAQAAERVDEARAQISAEVQRQIDSLLAEAEKQAENIRSLGKQSADRLRAEANTRADKVEADASNKSIIEQRLAKTAADGIRTEGENAARRAEQEAERQAEAVLNEARKKADELRNR